MSKPGQFLNLTEAAELLKVSKSSLRRWSNSGDLPSYRIGVRAERRFLLSDLLDFVGKKPAACKPQPAANTHICTNFKGREEQWRLLQPYLAAHLADDAAIVYLYQGDESRVRNWLTGDDSAGEMMRDGRFRLIPAQESYLQDGYFDLQRMLGFWRTIINEFQQRRITRLLLTGEMDWATLDAPGSDRLIEYEKQLDDFLQAYPSVTVVCQYALTEFPGATIFDSVCLHPTVLPAAGQDRVPNECR